MLSTVLCFLTIALPQIVNVVPGKTLGLQRSNFLSAVQAKLFDEFDDAAMSAMGETGATGFVAFPIGSAETLYLFEREGIQINGHAAQSFARCRIKAFSTRRGVAKLNWVLNLREGKGLKLADEGTLEAFARMESPRFRLPKRNPELRAQRALALYRIDKMVPFTYR